MKIIISIITLLITTFSSQASIITVVNTNDNGPGSLREAIVTAVNNDTIQFDPSLLSGSPTITLQSEIQFSKPLKIIGLYNSIDTLRISGNNICRIFNITNTTVVVLDSLFLTNGNSTGNGGAISFSNSNSLGINNSYIINNAAVDRGGGVYFDGNQLTMTFSVIAGNNSGLSGGGIFSTNNTTIWNSYISNNIGSNGGGISVSGNNTLSPNYVNIYNSTFIGNTAQSTGGGIRVVAFNLELSLINCLIEYNEAISGGGVYAHANTSVSSSSTLTVTNTTIRNNIANLLSGGGIYSNAGGFSMVSSNSTVNLTRSTINNNSAITNGGGIYVEAVGTKQVIANESTICNNIADNGGGIYAGLVTITNGTINNNNAITQGSNIYAVNTTIGSSIVACGSNNIYSDGSSPIISQGYNIFSDAPSGFVGTDQSNVTPSQINLMPLAYHGNGTQIQLPLFPSFTYNMGDPVDMSLAQNGSIIQGRREVGAAESCASSNVDNQNFCQSFTWVAGDGNTYTNDTSVFYLSTFPNSMGCDSFLVLSLSSLILTSNDVISTCDSVIWIDGNTYFSNNNSAIVTLTSQAGCDSIVTLDLTIISVDTSTTQLGPLLTSLATAATFQWIDCGTMLPIPGATNQNYTAVANGLYAVVVSQNGCTDTSDCIPVTGVGITYFNNDFGILIYPNPNTGLFTIGKLLDINKNIQVRVLDATSKLILEQIIPTGEQKVEIDITKYSNGIYYLQLIIDEEIFVKQIIKQ